jgi:hypothetical protein
MHNAKPDNQNWDGYFLVAVSLALYGRPNYLRLAPIIFTTLSLRPKTKNPRTMNAAAIAKM